MEAELRSLKGVADEVAAELDDGQASLAAFDETGASADADADADTSDEGTGPAAGSGAGASAPGLDDFAAATDEPAADAPGDGPVATAGTDEDAAVEVVIDQRELDSTVARELSTRDPLRTRLETLAVGDYVLSDRVAVERKSVADFLDTLLGGDRSLFAQARDLSRAYARPLLVVEGDDLYGARNVEPDAIRGALASLAVDFGLSVLRTTDEDDTAALLSVIARREQETRDRTVSAHGEKSTKTLAEQQEYVVSAVADVGPVTASSLLDHLGSVEAVMSADREALTGADGVGEVTADRIREVVGSEYAAGRRAGEDEVGPDGGVGAEAGDDG